MIAHVLAVDYDGTIADEGRVAEATAAALGRVRESGRKVILVTGRVLPDLRHACGAVDELFDVVVAENGALLYVPHSREVRILGEAPQGELVDALRRRGVPFELGSSLIATLEAHADASLAAIRETGVERSLIFNKGALMLLPGGVTKATGLLAALAAVELSPRNLVGIGDAENDHSFLALSECAVAVADAVPALRQRADYVARAPGGRGVVEFIEEHLLDDVAAIVPGLKRHHLRLGQDGAGAPTCLPAHATTLLVVGPSASGKSTLTGVLVERLVEAARAFCLFDPEGDHRTLAELPDVVVLGGRSTHTLPSSDELDDLLRRPASRLVLDLSALSLADKVQYATRALAAVTTARSTRGLPHWLIIDEAHHILPAEGSSAVELIRPGPESLCLITLSAEHLAPAALAAVDVVASTDGDAFRAAASRLGARFPAGGLDDRPLDRGEAVLARAGDPAARRFRVAPRAVEHRRHLRKYVEGNLPPERSFFFRGPAESLNLRAANLTRFCELAEGVDPATWEHHLRRGDYSAWIRAVIKDPGLADELAGLERNGGSADESRRHVLAAIRRRYVI
jgi:hydroxymethylpyrimidine pyrophosphatase-like HAD family hydrolase